MQFANLITEYDDRLSGDSYIDPLGVLVIWSEFGRQIFKNRVNSISNDVRNYTLNLLHHTLIWDLISDDSLVLKPSLIKIVGEKDSLTFRQACLLYLENVFTFAMVSAKAEHGVDASGILGSSKARSFLDQDKDPAIIFHHGKAGCLLVRQLSLGVSGRYKTPFMEIGFFDSGYRYHAPAAAPLWQQATTLFNSHKALRAVYRMAREQLVTLISTHSGSKPPRRHLKELPKSWIAAIRDAFATPGRVGAQTRDFWLSLTGLDTGASGALLKVLDAHAVEESADAISVEALFSEAGSRCASDDERKKLEHVQRLEPLLGELDLMFTVARHRKVHSLVELRKRWSDLGRDDNTLPLAAKSIGEDDSLRKVLTAGSGTGLRRFDRLIQVAQEPDMEKQLTALLDYHGAVMRSRGQLPWVNVRGEEVRVHARTVTLPVAEQWPLYRWVNSYYIPQFRNLVAGLQGKEA